MQEGGMEKLKTTGDGNYKILEVFFAPDGKKRRRVRVKATPNGKDEVRVMEEVYEEVVPDGWLKIPSEEKDLWLASEWDGKNAQS